MGLERDPEDLLMSSPDKQAESKSTLEPTRWRFSNHWCIVAAVLTGAALTLLFIAGTTLDQETMHRRLSPGDPLEPVRRKLRVVGFPDRDLMNGTYLQNARNPGLFNQINPEEHGCTITVHRGRRWNIFKAGANSSEMSYSGYAGVAPRGSTDPRLPEQWVSWDPRDGDTDDEWSVTWLQE